MSAPADPPAPPPPDGLHPTTWAVLRALRSGARLSRNRNFYLFQDPRARRAIKLHRYLDSVVRDVRAQQGQVSVDLVESAEAAGQIALRVEFPVINGRRTAYLSAAELALIAERAPEVAELLSAQLDPAQLEDDRMPGEGMPGEGVEGATDSSSVADADQLQGASTPVTTRADSE